MNNTQEEKLKAIIVSISKKRMTNNDIHLETNFMNDLGFDIEPITLDMKF